MHFFLCSKIPSAAGQCNLTATGMHVRYTMHTAHPYIHTDAQNAVSNPLMQRYN